MANFSLNGYGFYNVPKNAGTTVRMWLKFYQDALPVSRAFTEYYSLEKIGLPVGWLDRELNESQPLTCGRSNTSAWCIVRDPIERFISAFTDKILFERLAPWSVAECLSMLESGEMDGVARRPGRSSHKQAARHLLGQSVWLGSCRSFFDHVFHIKDMNEVRDFCEEMIFQKPLPKFHARNQAYSVVDKIVLSKPQIARLERIFKADYLAGWC